MRNHRGQKGSEKHGSVQEQEEGEKWAEEVCERGTPREVARNKEVQY